MDQQAHYDAHLATRWDRIESKLDKLADILAQQTIHENLLETHADMLKQHAALMERLHARLDENDRFTFRLDERVKKHDRFARWAVGTIATASTAAVVVLTQEVWHRLAPVLMTLHAP